MHTCTLQYFMHALLNIRVVHFGTIRFRSPVVPRDICFTFGQAVETKHAKWEPLTLAAARDVFHIDRAMVRRALAAELAGMAIEFRGVIHGLDQGADRGTLDSCCSKPSTEPLRNTDL